MRAPLAFKRFVLDEFALFFVFRAQLSLHFKPFCSALVRLRDLKDCPCGCVHRRVDATVHGRFIALGLSHNAPGVDALVIVMIGV